MLSAARAEAPETRRFDLPTGRLKVRVDEAAWPLDALCGFAARHNPKRGFLVVSRVLGRHVPVPPSLMRRSAHDLAARISAGLPGPILVLGLAETAVGLGQTVHQELRARTGRDDILFIHSTRQRIDAPLLCRFEEPHSHASSHLVYRPLLPGFRPPRSLVLVDDEISTGTTLANLAAALVECWPGIETIAVASLTDWSEGNCLQRLPRPAQSVSLLNGSLSWTAHERPPGTQAFIAPPGSLGTMRSHRNYGRLGVREPCHDLPDRLSAGLGEKPLRILGTGEFTFLPFLLAEQLERAGLDVVVQATSRSPARIGGAVRSALAFRDNYDTGVPSHLYNADPADGRETWICFETGEGSIDPALVDALGAQLVRWPA
jgi:hypothetical protein